MSYFDLSIKDFAKQMQSQQENLLREQLVDLIDNNILVIEQTQPVLIKTSEGKYVFEQSIKLTCREMDRIKELTEEVKSLKAKLEAIKFALYGPLSGASRPEEVNL